MEKRPYPPGEHGRTRRRGNVSEYLLQLQEKQKARFTYGIGERSSAPLRRGEPSPGRDRREPAALLRAPSRQHRVPRRLGGDSPAGPPVRRPRSHRRQRSQGQHPELPRAQGRRRPSPRQVARADRRPAQHGHPRPHAPAVARRPPTAARRSPSASSRSASRSTCPSASSSSSSSTPSSLRGPSHRTSPHRPHHRPRNVVHPR
jgi:hypothetical protein